MFKKKCQNCGEKIGRGFNFCPICGYNLKKGRKEDSGLLDNIEDEFESENNEIRSIEDLTNEIGKSMGFDFINRFPFNQIVKRLSKDIEKQFKDIDKEIARKKGKDARTEVMKEDGTEIRKTAFPGGFSIQIRMGGAPIPLTRTMIPQEAKEGGKKQPLRSVHRELSKKEQEMIARLPKQEPEAKVRRLTDKIIYEIALPGVKNKKDIIINKLENSIEIKAFSKDRAFFKLIPVALPIRRYDFKQGKLILELSP